MKDTVILIHPQGHEVPHNRKHAIKLMAMSNNGGWKLKDGESLDGSKKTEVIKEDNETDSSNIIGNANRNRESKGSTKRADK